MISLKSQVRRVTFSFSGDPNSRPHDEHQRRPIQPKLYSRILLKDQPIIINNACLPLCTFWSISCLIPSARSAVWYIGTKQGNCELWLCDCYQSEMRQDSKAPLFLVKSLLPFFLLFLKDTDQELEPFSVNSLYTLCKCTPVTEGKSSPL